MSGRFIAVVGPSGVGKDSVIRGLSMLEPGLVVARRVISRSGGAGGEDHAPVSVETFHQMHAAGALLLSWGAHGLFYGIPREVLVPLMRGRDVIANLSRGVLAEAARVLPDLVVLQLTAAPEVLAARLAARGRETAAEVTARLAREGAALPQGLHVIRIANDGTLAATVCAARAALYRARA